MITVGLALGSEFGLDRQAYRKGDRGTQVRSKVFRAKALRRSSGKNYEAHPAFWVPFVFVGDHGAAR
jgi:hypothetical protein